MYKKLCAFIVMIAFLGSTSFAAVYDAECLNTKGKMAECKVAISNNTVSIQSKRKRDAELNRTIAGQKISKITEGEYARRRVGEAVAGSIVFLPLALFVFAKKKKWFVLSTPANRFASRPLTRKIRKSKKSRSASKNLCTRTANYI